MQVSISRNITYLKKGDKGDKGDAGTNGVNASDYSLVCTPNAVVKQSTDNAYSASDIIVSVIHAEGDTHEALGYRGWNTAGLGVMLHAKTGAGTEYWQVFSQASSSLPISHAAVGGAQTFEVQLYRKGTGFPTVTAALYSAPTAAQGTLIAKETIPIVGNGATGQMGAKVRYLKWQDIENKLQLGTLQEFSFFSGSDDTSKFETSGDMAITASENMQFYDIIWYNNGTTQNWYLCKKGLKIDSDYINDGNTPISDTTHFQSSDTNMGFIATDVFFSRRAYIQNLAVDDIYIQDDEGNVVVELNADRQVMRGNVIANSLTLGAKELKTYGKSQIALAFSDVTAYDDNLAFGKQLAAANLEGISITSDTLAYRDYCCINKAFQFKSAGYGFHWLPALEMGSTKVCEVLFYTKDANYNVRDTNGNVQVPVIFCGTNEYVKVGMGGKLCDYGRLMRMPLYTGRYRFVGFCLPTDYLFCGTKKRWAKVIEFKSDGSQNANRMMWVDADNEYPSYASYRGNVYVYSSSSDSLVPTSSSLTRCNTATSTYTPVGNTYWCLSTDLDDADAVERQSNFAGVVDKGSSLSGICIEVLPDMEGSNTRGPASTQSTLH